ncbi:MAG TPA: FAD-dependent oxidoreductase [Pirellulaceae bacterium]|nr:FAD-dependent oxidoreductase [Pirellulaceae bacterium]
MFLFRRSARFVASLAVLALCHAVSPSPTTAADVAPDEGKTYDLIIYGGTSGAVTAAVQATRMGKSVVIVSPDRHLGGLSAGGLGWTDTGSKEVIGGVSREFYERVWKKYQNDDAWTQETAKRYGDSHVSPPLKEGGSPAMWVFEPHVAEAVFEDFVAEENIPLVREERLQRDGGKGVKMEGGRIVSLTIESGKTFRGRMFMDATYEGDLMAEAGVDFHVGREANAVYGEKWNGVQVGVLHHGHHFKKPVSPNVKPGDSSSGLLPLVSDEPPGEYGEGDHRVQAYCFRTCLTDDPDNRIPFPKPEGYDPATYELMLRVLDTGWREAFAKFDMIPNRKTDTNNHGPVSFDHIGANYDYPEASYERRAEIIQDHVVYQQGLLYFLANDPRVPEDVRAKMSKWGLAKDEFTDNGGWPHQIYVREARRMIGEYVMTEHDCLLTTDIVDSIGMGSYTIDSHNVQRYVKPDGYVQNEGDIGVGTPGPYRIAYGAIVPKREDCTNLFVPVAVSSSHIAYGSIRMEPVFMILGQSAATAAAMAIDGKLDVQDVPYSHLREKLLADGQVLEHESDKSLVPSKLPGVVVDDRQAKMTGAWASSASIKPYVGAGYLHDNDTAKGELTARFEAELDPGTYEIFVYYTSSSNRASNVPVELDFGREGEKIVIDQRQGTSAEKPAKSLGVFHCGGKTAVTVSNAGTDGHVVVDAVQFVPVEN